MTLEVDPTGSVTSALGFVAGAVYAGIKTYGDGKLDVAILASDRPAAVAATFTKTRLHSASVDVNRAKLGTRGRGQAVVVNAGCANSSTGQRGLDDARTVTEWTARKLGVAADDVFICSTGVIGHFLPMEKFEAGVNAVEPTPLGGLDFARAIMTTDTRPKHGAVRFGPYTLGGAAKGSGMIHPNMATMLAFLGTDAPVQPAYLQRCLSDAVEKSFNLVSVDGDTSPSDTALLFANGAAGGEEIREGTPYAIEFAAAVEALCVHLAKEMARDGEGATRLLEATVTGAATTADARELVRLLTTSYLLKSAVHGADPNWGRVVAVIGRSSAAYDEDAVTVSICGIRVFEHSRPTEFPLETLAEAMKGTDIAIEVSLGTGPGHATGWGCDLTAEYVHINADYHT
ncbi:MAG: bifunctional glutamate N-acetyltransferase/amino-acid acetyltransferase ArgJ [Dehalococcoidia bacterium]|nr:bifunctional glutamate N-acetyltransferase/amino-acid acetyltransferase ArgJ [Dehalococcoidia bacterium]